MHSVLSLIFAMLYFIMNTQILLPVLNAAAADGGDLGFVGGWFSGVS